MNKLLLILITFFLGNQVYALTPTPSITAPASTKISPTPAASESSLIDKSIKLLKDKIATQVAKMDKNIFKLNIGRIIKKDETSFEIKTKDAKTLKIVFDKTLTKIFTISGATKKEISFIDLKVDDYVIVSGPQLDNSITANNIYKDEEYVIASGKVNEIDRTNFSVKIMTTDKDDYTVFVESTTKQSIINIKTILPEQGAFSKLKVGDTVHFLAVKPLDPKKLEVTAIRFIVIPQEYFMK